MVVDTTEAVADLVERLRRHTLLLGATGQACSTGVDDLTVTQVRATTPLGASLYKPVMCLILQGTKEIVLGKRGVVCPQGHSIIVSHDLPLAWRITTASHDVPYLAMNIRLDTAVLRSLVDDLDDLVDLEDAEPGDDAPASLQVGPADADLVDAMRRLLALSANPRDSRALAPLVSRELHYRLLNMSHGAALRRLLHRNSHASRISRSIAQIRDSLGEPLSIPGLARAAKMSVSTFHHHFKAITETTPLQYQKQLRLLEARRLLVDEDRSVSETAESVGYHSATQFSREYARTFGVPPRDARSQVHLSVSVT